MKQRINHTATLHSGKLKVRVRITDENEAYGRKILTVTPVAGSGTERVNEDSLSNFSPSPASDNPASSSSASPPVDAPVAGGSTPDAG